MGKSNKPRDTFEQSKTFSTSSQRGVEPRGTTHMTSVTTSSGSAGKGAKREMTIEELIEDRKLHKRQKYAIPEG
jgi:hypothetical protein